MNIPANTIISIFLFYQSVELVISLHNVDPSQLRWVEITIISFILNLFITGIFAFLGFAFLTSGILPNSYYRIKNSKNLTFIYKVLGVEYFKVLLLKFFWGKEKNRKRYFNGTKAGIDAFDTQTRQSEFGHLAAFISIVFASFILLGKGHIAIFFITSLINLVANLYPIILQRAHRIQIERLRFILDNRKLKI